MIVEAPAPRSQKVTVLVDGIDVTKRCYKADSVRGLAWCYRKNDRGLSYVDPDTGRPAVEVLRGLVSIDVVASHDGRVVA